MPLLLHQAGRIMSIRGLQPCDTKDVRHSNRRRATVAMEYIHLPGPYYFYGVGGIGRQRRAIHPTGACCSLSIHVKMDASVATGDLRFGPARKQAARETQKKQMRDLLRRRGRGFSAGYRNGEPPTLTLRLWSTRRRFRVWMGVSNSPWGN